MGLFDKFLSNKESENLKYKPTSDFEAWMGILYGCMAADGIVGDFEIDSLTRMLIFNQKFADIDITVLYRSVIEAENKYGSIALIEACYPLIKEEEKSTLFSMVVEIALVDGRLEESEMKQIEYIAEKLQIDPILAEKIIEVMLIRNKLNRIVD